MRFFARVTRAGSSPLTRGKLVVNAVITWWLRLIPAHAGKTRLADANSPWSAAHPRSRGENESRRCSPVTSPGSSPLTRGKLRAVLRRLLSDGLIPAHAGKTCGFLQGGCEPGAHPRSRGENAVASAATHGVAGSSPLTRGKLGRAGQRDVGPRLIPAHAGKTTRPAGTRAARQAHPRSRGENPPPVRIGVADPGSSPLTRGKRCSLLRPSRSTRLIPAHAGKT